MPATSITKSELRSEYRARRSAITRAQRQAWSAELNRHLLAAAELREAKCVAAYLAFDAEPDIRFTLTQLHRRGVRLMLPVLPDDIDDILTFRAWTPATPLNTNRYGISEPRGTPDMPLERADVVLMPLVAFDLCGTRLGMGAGLYDRTLSANPTRGHRVGVAWSVQEAQQLPKDSWDVPLDAVATESGWFTCRG